MGRKIVAITGTKGKTTVSFLVDQIMQKLEKNTIRVDTTGHFVNNERKSTLEESKDIWGLVPTVCPGRFLWEMKNFTPEERDNTVAVLECAIGCSNMVGTGMRGHDVAIWTNVLQDHLGSTDRLQTRADIADAKEFIFSRLEYNGYTVFNACDDLVCSKLYHVQPTATKVPCIFDMDKVCIDLDEHLANGGIAFLVEDAQIYKLSKDGKDFVYDATNLPWTFRGFFKPSMINLCLTIAGVYGVLEGKLPDNLAEILDSIRLDQYGGRLTTLVAKSGTMIIADYAHEKESLVSIGHLAKKLAEERGGKTIGVVRLAYDRTDELIDETGQAVGEAFDSLVVYDKIDGYWRKPKETHHSKFVQEVGRISSLLSAAIKKTNPNVTTILREDEALEYTAKTAGENDVVIFIVNDDVHRSVDWVREKFDADFA